MSTTKPDSPSFSNFGFWSLNSSPLAVQTSTSQTASAPQPWRVDSLDSTSLFLVRADFLEGALSSQELSRCGGGVWATTRDTGQKGSNEERGSMGPPLGRSKLCSGTDLVHRGA